MFPVFLSLRVIAIVTYVASLTFFRSGSLETRTRFALQTTLQNKYNDDN